MCELYAQKNKKIIKSIEEILDGAHPNPAKHTGKVQSLWNWRISTWKLKEDLEQNVQHVITGLQTDFQGCNKDWFLEKINQDKALLANMKSKIKQCLREATVTPSLLQMHSKSPFERSFMDWCKKEMAMLIGLE